MNSPTNTFNLPTALKIILLSSVFCLSTLNAQGEFYSLGLSEDYVEATAVNPNNPNEIYVSTDLTFYKSEDAGLTWSVKATGALFGPIAIHPQHSDTLMVLTLLPLYPGILKSTDGGASFEWSDRGIYKDWETGPLDIVYHPTKPETLYVAVNGYLGGDFYKSYSGGHRWIPVEIPGAGNGVVDMTIDPSQPSSLYVSENYFGRVAKSEDDGNTWTYLNVPWVEDGIPHLEVDRANSDRLYAGVWGYGLAISNNGGESWDMQYSLGDILLDSARISIQPDIFDSNHVYLGIGGLDFTGVFESFDRGNTWEVINDTLNVISLSQCQITGKLYISTISGVYVFDYYSGIQDDLVNTPEAFNLTTFPNPFNADVTLNFTLPYPSSVRIYIYNIAGKTVKRFWEGNLNKGNHQILWNAKNDDGIDLPSGVYFCRLEVNGFSQTHKMILMK